MTEQELRDLVRDCDLDWQRGYILSDDVCHDNRYARLIDAARAPLLAALKKANDQAEHFEREWYLRGDELESLRAERYAARAALAVESDSRGMFVARLENMWQNGDHWLTVMSVLALLNDCDMLAASPKEKT